MKLAIPVNPPAIRNSRLTRLPIVSAVFGLAGPPSDPFRSPGRPGLAMLAALAALALALLASGCGEPETAVEQPIPAEQVPSRVEEAFRGASPAVVAEADAVVTSVREEDPSALEKLRQLSVRPDLTPEQRAVAGRSMYSLLARLQAAETNGNQKAAEALQQYRSTK